MIYSTATASVNPGWTNGVIAYDIDDDEEIWEDDDDWPHRDISYEDGVLYAGTGSQFDDAIVRAFDANNGELLWEHEEQEPGRVEGVFASGGVVYSGSQGDTVLATEAV